MAPARSKNKYQQKIAAALNYKGSPIQKLLANGGKEVAVELPSDDDEPPFDADEPAPEQPAAKPTAKPAAAARKPVTKAAKGDPLAGIADE